MYLVLVGETADVLGSVLFRGGLVSALFVLGRLAVRGGQGWGMVA